MFADDVLLYKPITTRSDLITFQNDVDTIGQWSLLNHLSPNNNKTKFMVISRSKHYSQCPHILLAGIEFEQVSHFKYLGVWISADLTWFKHIMSVTCKARQLLGYTLELFPSLFTICYYDPLQSPGFAHSQLQLYHLGPP